MNDSAKLDLILKEVSEINHVLKLIARKYLTRVDSKMNLENLKAGEIAPSTYTIIPFDDQILYSDSEKCSNINVSEDRNI